MQVPTFVQTVSYKQFRTVSYSLTYVHVPLKKSERGGSEQVCRNPRNPH